MAAGVAYWAQSGSDQSQKTLSSAQQAEKNIAAFSDNDEKEDKASKVKSKKARQEYFFRLMRDPATNAIPENIRSREINHAKSMPSILQVTQSMKAQNPAMKVAEGFEWRLAGPPAVAAVPARWALTSVTPILLLRAAFRAVSGSQPMAVTTGNYEPPILKILVSLL